MATRSVQTTPGGPGGEGRGWRGLAARAAAGAAILGCAAALALGGQRPAEAPRADPPAGAAAAGTPAEIARPAEQAQGATDPAPDCPLATAGQCLGQWTDPGGDFAILAAPVDCPLDAAGLCLGQWSAPLPPEDTRDPWSTEGGPTR